MMILIQNLIRRIWPQLLAGLTAIAMAITFYFKGKSVAKNKQLKESLKDIQARNEKANQIRNQAEKIKEDLQTLITNNDDGSSNDALSRVLSSFPVKS